VLSQVRFLPEVQTCDRRRFVPCQSGGRFRGRRPAAHPGKGEATCQDRHGPTRTDPATADQRQCGCTPTPPEHAAGHFSRWPRDRHSTVQRPGHTGSTTVLARYNVRRVRRALQHAAAASSAAAVSATPGSAFPPAGLRQNPAPTGPRRPDQPLPTRSLKPLIRRHGRVLESHTGKPAGGNTGRAPRLDLTPLDVHIRKPTRPALQPRRLRGRGERPRTARRRHGPARRHGLAPVDRPTDRLVRTSKPRIKREPLTASYRHYQHQQVPGQAHSNP
jgi:hypothetical protein